MTNNQVEDRVRMFIVSGLPDKHIPVPAQTVLRAYLEGDSKLMVEYLKEQLAHQHVVGSYWVSVDSDIVNDHLEEDIDRVSVLARALMLLIDDLSSTLEGPGYRAIKNAVESTIIGYVPTNTLRIHTNKEGQQ